MRYYYRKKIWAWLAFAVDVLSGIFAMFKRKKLFPKEIKKILLLRLDHLGDVLYVLPAISAVRKQYPNARITLLVASWAKGLVDGNPDIDEIIVFNAPWFQRSIKKTGFKQLLGMISQLRAKKYDLAIDFSGYLWNIFLICLSGAKYKVSCNDVGGRFLLDKALPRRTDLQVVRQNLKMLDSLGINISQQPVVRLAIKPEDVSAVDQLIDENGIKADKMIAIHCGAGRATKLWPIQKYNKLINALFDEYPGYEIVLVGSPSEDRLISRLKFAKDSPKSLVGKTNISELAAFLKRCRLFIGNDSAPAHLAAVMGTPTIVLFSKEDDPTQWRPWGERVFVIQKEGHAFRSLSEREIMASLEKISVADILDKVKQVLR